MNGSCDLLPGSCRAVFNRRRRVHRWVMCYGVCLLVLGTFVALMAVEKRARLQRRDALAARANERWMRNEEAREILNEIRDLESAIARYNRLAWPVRVSDAVSILTPIVPESTTLTSMTVVPREEKPKRPRRGEKSDEQRPGRSFLVIELEGMSLNDMDIAKIVSRVEEHPLFTGVALDYARSRDIDEVDARAFRLSCEIELDRRYAFANVTEEAQ